MAVMSQSSRPGFEKYMEKYKSEKVAFITEKLDLSVEEAQKFWPLYNEYEKQKEEVIQTRRRLGRNNSFQDMDDKDLEIMVDEKVEHELKLAEMKMEFHKQVKGILPIKKVVILYRAENEFMSHKLNQIRGKERGRRGPGRSSTPDLN